MEWIKEDEFRKIDDFKIYHQCRRLAVENQENGKVNARARFAHARFAHAHKATEKDWARAKLSRSRPLREHPLMTSEKFSAVLTPSP